MEDDGVDRGIVSVGICSNLERQFEFLKTQWIDQELFFGAPGEKDPPIGPSNCFIPSLSALRWLAALDTQVVRVQHGNIERRRLPRRNEKRANLREDLFCRVQRSCPSA